MARSKKDVDGIRAHLKVIKKSGSFVCGIKQSQKEITKNATKLVLISANCPKTESSMIKYYGMLGRVRTILYKGNSVDLGNVMGKRFPAYCVSIQDLGESNLLEKLR
eukprot:GAHX01001058.1.p1 GENE.GAHX01001058.1~~GAHX01001058.1.p1  ORF type:complete len:120 (-),score=17.58 GAHX01001058.1:564-884(-)